MVSSRRLKRYRKEIKSYKSIYKNNLILFLVLIFIVGILIGCILADNINYNQSLNFKNSIINCIEKFKSKDLLNVNLLKDSIFKYSKNIIFIWILGFVNIGLIMSIILLSIKGVSLGFVTYFLISNNGFNGILQVCSLYLVQNLVLVPIYIVIVYNSIKFDVFIHGSNFKRYIILLFLCLILVFFIALYELHILPQIINLIF